MPIPLPTTSFRSPPPAGSRFRRRRSGVPALARAAGLALSTTLLAAVPAPAAAADDAPTEAPTTNRVEGERRGKPAKKDKPPKRDPKSIFVPTKGPAASHGKKPKPKPAKRDRTGDQACADILAELETLHYQDTACAYEEIGDKPGSWIYKIQVGKKLESEFRPPEDEEFWKAFSRITVAVALADRDVMTRAKSASVRLFGAYYLFGIEDAWRCGTDWQCVERRTEKLTEQ